MDVCEVFKVKVGKGFKWVVVTGRKDVPANVAGSEKLRDLAVRLAGAKTVVEKGPLTIPEFLSLARDHPVLKQIPSWEPFGLLH